MHFKNPCLILEALLAFRLTALRILSERIQVFILGISWNQTFFNWKASENLSQNLAFFNDQSADEVEQEIGNSL